MQVFRWVFLVALSLNFSAAAGHLPEVHMMLTAVGWMIIAVKCLEFAAVLSRN